MAKSKEMSRITVSSIFGALGLNTLKDHPEHHGRDFRHIEKPVSEKLSRMLEYGTLVGKILLATIPNLCYKQDECAVIPFSDTKTVVSRNETGITKGEEMSVIAFEFKCPNPEKAMKNAQYEIHV